MLLSLSRQPNTHKHLTTVEQPRDKTPDQLLHNTHASVAMAARLKHWRRHGNIGGESMAFGGRDSGRNAGQPQDNRGTTLLIERGNHRTTMGQDPASASSAGEAKEGYMANHSRGSDQPPHKQLISWFSVQPERLKSTKKPTQTSYFHKLACS